MFVWFTSEGWGCPHLDESKTGGVAREGKGKNYK